MAVECELARVFVKWEEIDLGVSGNPTPKDKNSRDAELREGGKIAVKPDRLSEFLTRHDFDAFADAVVDDALPGHVEVPVERALFPQKTTTTAVTR